MVRLLWGPVVEEHASSVGVPSAVASVLIEPEGIDAALLQRVAGLVPSEVLPLPSDSKESLCARLKASDWLTPAHVLTKGNGKNGYINVNATDYRQPRRKQWSCVVIPEHTDQDGDQVVGCVCYPHLYTRSPLDEKWCPCDLM